MNVEKRYSPMMLRSVGMTAITVCQGKESAEEEARLRPLLAKRVESVSTCDPALALRLRDELQGTPEENGLFPDESFERVMREGARIMLEADTHRLEIKQKDGVANFVTEYDVKVQRFLEDAFRALIPGCEFLAEEDGDSDHVIGDAYTFVIDPIDGTTNFMLGRRASCISVALLKNKKAVFGAVYDPYADRYYSAMPHLGAYCNHRPIRVSERAPAAGVASLGTSPYQRDVTARPVSEIAYELLMRFGDIRRIGSAALEICAVACGELDAYCEPILSPWDFAAGQLILTEAGGVSCDFSGNPLTFASPTSVVATTPTAKEAVLAAVKGKL